MTEFMKKKLVSVYLGSVSGFSVRLFGPRLICPPLLTIIPVPHLPNIQVAPSATI
jgi:hypothetical protein